MGKQFSVEIGTIGQNSEGVLQDLSGNILASNIIVNKTFANLDLS